jgi:hypothetical protein
MSIASSSDPLRSWECGSTGACLNEQRMIDGIGPRPRAKMHCAEAGISVSKQIHTIDFIWSSNVVEANKCLLGNNTRELVFHLPTNHSPRLSALIVGNSLFRNGVIQPALLSWALITQPRWWASLKKTDYWIKLWRTAVVDYWDHATSTPKIVSI